MNQSNSPRVVIAIPAMNEASRIGECLESLASQVSYVTPTVLLFANNCTDGTERVAAATAGRTGLSLRIVSRVLPPAQASAGIARSIAMQLAAEDATADTTLLTTDADTRAPAEWLSANLAALRRADAVAGRAVIDPQEAFAIPAKLHDDDAHECRFATLLDEIASCLDPDPADPWPRHDEHSGASIAVRLAVYRAAGGVPAIALGEDRGFFTSLRHIDARVRHAPEVWVTVSGRIFGRASGGMADTIRRRMSAPDVLLDDRVEAVDVAVRRAMLRRRARQVHAGTADAALLAREMQVPALLIRRALGSQWFGAGWDTIEAACTSLKRRRVPVAELAMQTARATAVLAKIRQAQNGLVDTRRGGPRDRIGAVASQIA